MEGKVNWKCLAVNTHFASWLLPLQHALWDFKASMSWVHTLMLSLVHSDEPNMKVNSDTYNHKHAIKCVHSKNLDNWLHKQGEINIAKQWQANTPKHTFTHRQSHGWDAKVQHKCHSSSSGTGLSKCWACTRQISSLSRISFWKFYMA